MATPLRVPTSQQRSKRSLTPTAEAPAPPSRHGMAVGSIAGGLLAVVLLGGLIVLLVSRPSHAVPNAVSAPVGRHQIVLHDWAEKPWITYSTAHAAFLGDPIWGEQPYHGHADCVGYENYVVCTSTQSEDESSIRQFQPLLLGRDSLARTRTAPRPGSAVTPIVQQYFDHLYQDAVSQGQTDFTTESDLVAYWFGRPEGSVTCVSEPHGAPGQCLQVFERQVVRWPQGATNPDDVQLWPLGSEAPRP